MARQRQLHLWLTDTEFIVLRELAALHDETVSALVRRLVRAHHHHLREIRPQDARLRDIRYDAPSLHAANGIASANANGIVSPSPVSRPGVPLETRLSR